MGEIPEDVIDLAEEYYESVISKVAGDLGPMPVGGWKGEYTRTFARAILAERQRCADVVRRLPGNTGVYIDRSEAQHAILNS
ncbi:hypothetical protein CO659_12530 [Rhizobium sp. S9]|nr:hypothetical protein CO659_12530 [Rhizobium sp. S9]